MLEQVLVTSVYISISCFQLYLGAYWRHILSLRTVHSICADEEEAGTKNDRSCPPVPEEEKRDCRNYISMSLIATPGKIAAWVLKLITHDD